MCFLAIFFFRYLFQEEAGRAPSQGELFTGKWGGLEFVVSGGYGGAEQTVSVVSGFSWRIRKIADCARRTSPSDVSGSSSPQFKTCWNTGGFFFSSRYKMKEKNKIPAKVLRAALGIQFLGSMMFHFSNCWGPFPKIIFKRAAAFAYEET